MKTKNGSNLLNRSQIVTYYAPEMVPPYVKLSLVEIVVYFDQILSFF